MLALVDQGKVLRAVDTDHGSAPLLIGLLLDHGQPMIHLTGLAVHRASAGYRSQGKTDTKNARVIADQARIRHDFCDPVTKSPSTGASSPVTASISSTTAHARSTDCANNPCKSSRNWKVPCPGKGRGPIVLPTGYQAPGAIRRIGVRRLNPD